MQSGKELSLTSESRNNKPGSAKSKKAMCNGFHVKIYLFLLVCFDTGTSQIHMPTDICFYAPIHLYVSITLLIALLFYTARMFHQLVLLLFKCCYACPSKPLKWIESLCTIDAVSPKSWWPVAVDLHLRATPFSCYKSCAFSSTDEHMGLITFLHYELTGGRWRNRENEIPRKKIH